MIYFVQNSNTLMRSTVLSLPWSLDKRKIIHEGRLDHNIVQKPYYFHDKSPPPLIMSEYTQNYSRSSLKKISVGARYRQSDHEDFITSFFGIKAPLH